MHRNMHNKIHSVISPLFRIKNADTETGWNVQILRSVWIISAEIRYLLSEQKKFQNKSKNIDEVYQSVFFRCIMFLSYRVTFLCNVLGQIHYTSESPVRYFFYEKVVKWCLSKEMLQKLIEKQPDAKVVQANLLEYSSEEKFDYIFITSGSVSLFTDIALCKEMLSVLKRMLAPNGTLVFAVDTVANICPEDTEYRTDVVKETKDGYKLILKTKNHYDVQSQTQFSPGLYELYHGDTLVQRERMDFQTHLYKFGEMEQYLKEIGFSKVKTYASFSKELAVSDNDEMFLFECME